MPEEKGAHLIEKSPLPAGVCYTSTSDGENVALIRIETIAVQGSGKLYITGVNTTTVKENIKNTYVKENIKNTYQYIKANEKTILSERHSLKNYDITIQVSNLLGASISSGIGSAVYVAIVSALYKKNLKAGLAVLGNVSVGGAIERAANFAEKVTMLSENGAKVVVVPMDNLQELSNIPATVLGNTDVPFYQNNQMMIQKAILMD